MSGADLARAANTTPQAMNGVLATLKREGLIYRHPHPTHGRILQVTLTQEGKRRLDAGTPSVRALEEAAEMDLTPDQMAATTNWLVIHPPAPNGGAEQAMDGTEALPALQLQTPPVSDPEPILLVIHGHDPLRRPPLGEEPLEAVEAADIEDARPGEVLGQPGHAVAMVACGAGPVDPLS